MASDIDLDCETDKVESDEEPPELFKKSELTDITLIVEGKQLHFAKYLLMEGSSVFTQMIKNSADPSRLKVDDLIYKDFIAFLQCLHPKCFLELTDTTLEPVASIARRFEYERILGICERYIIRKFKKTRTTDDRMYSKFIFHLKVADKCGLKRAIQIGISCEQVALAFFSDQGSGWYKTIGYENNTDFGEISLETKFKIVCRRLKEAENKIPSDNRY